MLYTFFFNTEEVEETNERYKLKTHHSKISIVNILAYVCLEFSLTINIFLRKGISQILFLPSFTYLTLGYEQLCQWKVNLYQYFNSCIIFHFKKYHNLFNETPIFLSL